MKKEIQGRSGGFHNVICNSVNRTCWSGNPEFKDSSSSSGHHYVFISQNVNKTDLIKIDEK